MPQRPRNGRPVRWAATFCPSFSAADLTEGETSEPGGAGYHQLAMLLVDLFPETGLGHLFNRLISPLALSFTTVDSLQFAIHRFLQQVPLLLPPVTYQRCHRRDVAHGNPQMKRENEPIRTNFRFICMHERQGRATGWEIISIPCSTTSGTGSARHPSPETQKVTRLYVLRRE